MPITRQPKGQSNGGQFAPGKSGGGVVKGTAERNALASQIKIRRNLARHYQKEGGAAPETIANLKKGIGIHGKTRGDAIRSINNKGTAERNEKAATLRDERTRAQIRSKLGYAPLRPDVLIAGKPASKPPAINDAYSKSLRTGPGTAELSARIKANQDAKQRAAGARPGVDPGVARIRALGEKFNKLQKASDTKNKVDDANRIERKTANVFADRARYAKEDAKAKIRKGGGKGSRGPRKTLMADGTYRVGGKVVLPKGVGRRDRNGRVTRSSTIGGVLIRYKE